MIAHMDPPGRVLPSHRLMGGCATGWGHIFTTGLTIMGLPSTGFPQ